MGIHGIKREGADLARPEFDRLVKIAAAGMVSRRLCASLGSKPEEERYRFGFTA
jgi:hypothetical protein